MKGVQLVIYLYYTDYDRLHDDDAYNILYHNYQVSIIVDFIYFVRNIDDNSKE